MYPTSNKNLNNIIYIIEDDISSEDSKIEDIKSILEENPKNSDYGYPLYYAIENDCENIANLLLEYGADPTISSHSSWNGKPINLALDRQMTRCFIRMLKYIDCSKYGLSLLKSTISYDNYECSEAITSYGIDVNQLGIRYIRNGISSQLALDGDFHYLKDYLIFLTRNKVNKDFFRDRYEGESSIVEKINNHQSNHPIYLEIKNLVNTFVN